MNSSRKEKLLKELRELEAQYDRITHDIHDLEYERTGVEDELRLKEIEYDEFIQGEGEADE